MVEGSILAHHFDEVHLIGLRVKDFSLRIFGIEFGGPRAFEVSRVGEHDLCVRRDVGWREKLWNVSLRHHAHKVVDFFERLDRLLLEVQQLSLVDDDVRNARIQLDLFGEVESIDRRELDRCVGLVVVAIALLELIAFEDVGLAVGPVELQDFLEKLIRLISAKDISR